MCYSAQSNICLTSPSLAFWNKHCTQQSMQLSGTYLQGVALSSISNSLNMFTRKCLAKQIGPSCDEFFFVKILSCIVIKSHLVMLPSTV